MFGLPFSMQFLPFSNNEISFFSNFDIDIISFISKLFIIPTII
jgi:hypothetical protein